MGWNGNIVFPLLVVQGNTGGLFIYDSAGNLIDSAALLANVDPDTHTNLPGLVNYSGLSAVQLANGAVRMVASGSLVGFINQGSPLLSGLFLQANNGPVVIFPRAAAALPGGGSTPETTHALGAFSTAGVGFTIATYTLLPDGRPALSLKGAASAPVGAGNGTFANTMPAAYQPATVTDMTGQVATGATMRVSVSTGGVVSLDFPALSTGNRLGFQGAYDLQ